MSNRRGFTLIELLVVIAIIALLMSILIPALSKAKDQAKAVICLSNMHQFAIIWKLYTDDHNGSFPEGLSDWVEELPPYIVNLKLLLCPSAKKTILPIESGVGQVGGKLNAWYHGGEDLKGSYGVSHWLSTNTDGNRDGGRLWSKVSPKKTGRIPIMVDCATTGFTPQVEDEPPEYDGDIYDSRGTDRDEIISCVLNRHNFHVNVTFMDWSARPVRLKRLWRLEWHQTWTKDLAAAGITIDWDDPEHWMYGLPE